MAITRIQAKAKNSGTSTVSIGAGDAWAAPTAGRLLLAFVSGARTGDTIAISSQAWTLLKADSVSSGAQQGLATFYRIADGTETTVTATIGGGGTTLTLGVIEYSGLAAFGTGVGPIDYPPFSRDGGAATSTSWVWDAGTLDDTRAAAELWIAVAGTSGTITGASASGGFASVLTLQRLYVAELIVAARGDAQTTLSVTTSGTTRIMSQLFALADIQLPPHFVGWGAAL